MVRVLVADDQALIRQAVVGILDLNDEIEVVGQAKDGYEAIDLAQESNPDVVLMDIRMPRLDGIEATKRICSGIPSTKVLILTTFEEDEFVFAALRAGASGFIGKGTEPEDIAEAIFSVHKGDALLSVKATQSLIESYLDSNSSTHLNKEIVNSLHHLTGREQEVLQAVGKGLSNQEIADHFFISPLTVKTHVNRIMSKLHAHDRAQLVITAYEGGLVVPGSNQG